MGACAEPLPKPEWNRQDRTKIIPLGSLRLKSVSSEAAAAKNLPIRTNIKSPFPRWQLQ